MGTLDLSLWVLVEPFSGRTMAEGEGSGSCRVSQALGVHGSCELLLLQGAVLQGCHKLLCLLGAQGEREGSIAQSHNSRTGLGLRSSEGELDTVGQMGKSMVPGQTD